MIVAVMQPIYPHEQSIALRDGIVETDQERVEQIFNEIYATTKKIRLGHSKKLVVVGNKTVCLVHHPINDSNNRRRIAIIVWGKDTPKKEIEQTFTQIGLSFSDFLELEKNFNSQQNKKKMIIFGLALLSAIIFFLILK